MSEQKQEYRAFCLREPGLSLYLQDWWLDAVCGESHWNVALAKRNHKIMAALPYFKTKKWGFNIICEPPLTQTLGPWIHYPNGQKMATRFAWEKDMLTELIQAIPPFDLFRYNLHPALTNWLPFHWQGFKQTTRYTYLFRDLSDLNALFSNFSCGVKTDIQKASRSVQIRETDDIESIFHLFQDPFKRQGLPGAYSLNIVNRLDQACKQRGCRKILTAVDQDGLIRGALFLAWDGQQAHTILHGHRGGCAHEGIPSLLRWEAIQLAAKLGRTFNFSGSMMEGVERFIRAFGGEQQPYHQVVKIHSFFLKCRAAFKSG